MEPTRMQQPVNPLVIAEALRRLNSAPSQNTAAMKVEDTRLRNLNQVENLQRNPVIASNPGSAVVGGVAQGIARMLARQRGEKDLNAAYAEYKQAEDAKAAQAAEAAAEADRVKRQRELQDMAWTRGSELDAERRANAENDRRFYRDRAASGSGGPKLPTGYTWNESGTEAVPIPGTSAAMERAAAEEAETAAGRKQQSILRDIEAVLKDRGSLETFSGSSGAIPGSMAVAGAFSPEFKSWQARLDRVLGSATVEELQNMKGNPSDKDMEVVQQAASSLRQGGDIRSNAEALKDLYRVLGGDVAGLPEYNEAETTMMGSLQDKASMAIGDMIDWAIGDSSVKVKRVK